MNDDTRNSEAMEKAKHHAFTVIFPLMIRLRKKIDRIKAAALIDEEALVAEMRESGKEHQSAPAD